jgi:riboflavin kinase/FMN adenylyltransferase
MIVFRNLEDVPKDFGPTLVSIGNFDGVHCAHRHVIECIVERARAQKIRAVAVTFEPHPVRLLRPGADLKLLTPTPEKLALLKATGLDATLLLPFTPELSHMSAHDFAACILQETLRARELHEGFNFRFGHQAEGNILLLTEFGREMGFFVVEYPEMKLRGELVASSRIRALLREGRVDRARHLLARPFSILSTPAPGRGYGTKQAVPTINLAEYAELIPKNGVYITRTRVADECFDSVTNIGNRPTFGKDSFAIESHLLKFHPVELNQDTEIEIYFLDRIRDERKFPSVEDLRAQIGKDIARAQRYLRRLGAPSFPEKELSK